MTSKLNSSIRLYRLFGVLFPLFACIGCSTLRLPASLPFGSSPETEYVGSEGAPLRPSDSAMMVQKIRQAKSQNSIVLQVAELDPPVRILPLPPAGQSVFVSDLLTQTGVISKLERVDATLYRDAPGMPGGIRMAVKMSPGHDSVRPESDYALQAGDRLVVQKNEGGAFQGLLSGILGF